LRQAFGNVRVSPVQIAVVLLGFSDVQLKGARLGISYFSEDAIKPAQDFVRDRSHGCNLGPARMLEAPYSRKITQLSGTAGSSQPVPGGRSKLLGTRGVLGAWCLMGDCRSPRRCPRRAVSKPFNHLCLRHGILWSPASPLFYFVISNS
jgi:hypothetical protein